MIEEEMLAAGMSLNADGFWISSKMPDRVKDHHEHNNVKES